MDVTQTVKLPELDVFRLAKAVVGKQLVTGSTTGVPDERCDGLDIALGIVHSGNDGGPYGHIAVGKLVSESSEVAEDLVVGNSRCLLVLFRVEALDVEKDLICERSLLAHRAQGERPIARY